MGYCFEHATHRHAANRFFLCLHHWVLVNSYFVSLSDLPPLTLTSRQQRKGFFQRFPYVAESQHGIHARMNLCHSAIRKSYVRATINAIPSACSFLIQGRTEIRLFAQDRESEDREQERRCRNADSAQLRFGRSWNEE